MESRRNGPQLSSRHYDDDDDDDFGNGDMENAGSSFVVGEDEFSAWEIGQG